MQVPPYASLWEETRSNSISALLKKKCLVPLKLINEIRLYYVSEREKAPGNSNE